MMNERIKELAEQATIYVTGFPILDEQKFAEMIVKECLMICKNIERYDNGQDEPETIGHIRAGAAFCREDIKEHFGVE